MSVFVGLSIYFESQLAGKVLQCLADHCNSVPHPRAKSLTLQLPDGATVLLSLAGSKKAVKKKLKVGDKVNYDICWPAKKTGFLLGLCNEDDLESTPDGRQTWLTYDVSIELGQQFAKLMICSSYALEGTLLMIPTDEDTPVEKVIRKIIRAAGKKALIESHGDEYAYILKPNLEDVCCEPHYEQYNEVCNAKSDVPVVDRLVQFFQQLIQAEKKPKKKQQLLKATAETRWEAYATNRLPETDGELRYEVWSLAVLDGLTFRADFPRFVADDYQYEMEFREGWKRILDRRLGESADDLKRRAALQEQMLNVFHCPIPFEPHCRLIPTPEEAELSKPVPLLPKLELMARCAADSPFLMECRSVLERSAAYIEEHTEYEKLNHLTHRLQQLECARRLIALLSQCADSPSKAADLAALQEYAARESRPVYNIYLGYLDEAVKRKDVLMGLDAQWHMLRYAPEQTEVSRLGSEIGALKEKFRPTWKSTNDEYKVAMWSVIEQRDSAISRLPRIDPLPLQSSGQVIASDPSRAVDATITLASLKQFHESDYLQRKVSKADSWIHHAMLGDCLLDFDRTANVLRVELLEDGKVIAEPLVPPEYSDSVDGEPCLVSSQGALLQGRLLWRSVDQPCAILPGDPYSHSSVCFSPSGKLLVYWEIADRSRSNTWRLNVLSVDDLSPRGTWPISAEEYRKAVCSYDACYLVTMTAESAVRLWSIAEGSLIATLLPPQSKEVYSISFSPDDRWVLVRVRDLPLMQFSVPEGELVAQYEQGIGYRSDMELRWFGNDQVAILEQSQHGFETWSLLEERQLGSIPVRAPYVPPVPGISWFADRVKIPLEGATIEDADPLGAFKDFPQLLSSFSPELQKMATEMTREVPSQPIILFRSLEHPFTPIGYIEGGDGNTTIRLSPSGKWMVFWNLSTVQSVWRTPQELLPRHA